MLGRFLARGAGGLAEAERRVAQMPCLAPGDFAAVRRRLGALGVRLAPAELADALAAELAARGAPRGPAGFQA